MFLKVTFQLKIYMRSGLRISLNRALIFLFSWIKIWKGLIEENLWLWGNAKMLAFQVNMEIGLFHKLEFSDITWAFRKIVHVLPRIFRLISKAQNSKLWQQLWIPILKGFYCKWSLLNTEERKDIAAKIYGDPREFSFPYYFFLGE